MSRRPAVLLAASFLLACGCAPAGFLMTGLAREIRYCSEYRDYRTLVGAKAWAVAGDPCGVFVSGLAYEEPDPQTAELRALVLCEARRSDRRVEAPCIVHVRGDCSMAAAELRYCRSLPGTGEDCPERIESQRANCPDRLAPE